MFSFLFGVICHGLAWFALRVPPAVTRLTVYRWLHIFVAMEVFFCHVLRILLSEFDESQKQTSLGIKVSCCASGMSVIIMSAEPSGRTGFVT